VQGPAVPTVPVPAFVVYTAVNRWQYCCRLQYVWKVDTPSYYYSSNWKQGRNDKSIAKMPISSSQYTIYLANSNLGGGFTLVFTWSPEKKRN